MFEYERDALNRVRVIARKAWLMQVVTILLINAISYSKPDPEAFKVRFTAEETKDGFIIILKDWGIGIAEGMEEKIFEAGFRTPSAIEKNVMGSGLGLTIARKLMRESGGDLVLSKNRFNPTEFQMILPKHFEEVSRDTVR